MKAKRTFLLMMLAIAAVSVSINAQAAGRNDGKPDGGQLGYGEYGRPATLDPITSNDMVSLRISELLFNGLVGINDRQEIVPELAQRWEISDDGSTYTFYLRQDVTWHQKGDEDPGTFTADDVIATYNIMTHPKNIPE